MRNQALCRMCTNNESDDEHMSSNNLLILYLKKKLQSEWTISSQISLLLSLFNDAFSTGGTEENHKYFSRIDCLWTENQTWNLPNTKQEC
jgi:hypothetical protein